MRTLKQLESMFYELKGRKKTIQEQLNKARIQLAINKKKERDIKTAIEVAQIVAELTQEEVIVSINDMASAAIHAVFPEDPYDFELNITRKNNRTQAEPYYIRNGHRVKPVDNTGVGAANIGAVALRVGLLSMDETKPRRLLILDEPFRDLSKNKHPLAATLVNKISQDLKIQIILASHSEALAETVDKIFNIAKKKTRLKLRGK